MTLDVAHARGAPRAIGRVQGEAFAPGIHAALGFYRELAAAHATALDPRAPLVYLEHARRAVGDLVEELEGLAEGAGIPLADALLLSCLEEVATLDACTTLVHGPFLLHAEQWYAGHAAVGVVVVEPDDGPAFVSPTCAGFPPAVGLSSAGFAQGIDSLRAADDRIGVPRALVARLALGAPGFAAAVAAACTRGRAGGYAHVLATLERSVAVETSATRDALVEDVDAHTNHYLAASMSELAPPASRGSRARLERARRLVAESPPATLEDCTAILADHEAEPEAICVHEDGLGASATVFGMACDLASERMLVSDGPPCAGRWEELTVPASRADARRVG